LVSCRRFAFAPLDSFPGSRLSLVFWERFASYDDRFLFPYFPAFAPAYLLSHSASPFAYFEFAALLPFSFRDSSRPWRSPYTYRDPLLFDIFFSNSCWYGPPTFPSGFNLRSDEKRFFFQSKGSDRSWSGPLVFLSSLVALCLPRPTGSWARVPLRPIPPLKILYWGGRDSFATVRFAPA